MQHQWFAEADLADRFPVSAFTIPEHLSDVATRSCELARAGCRVDFDYLLGVVLATKINRSKSCGALMRCIQTPGVASE